MTIISCVVTDWFLDIPNGAEDLSRDINLRAHAQRTDNHQHCEITFFDNNDCRDYIEGQLKTIAVIGPFNLPYYNEIRRLVSLGDMDGRGFFKSLEKTENNDSFLHFGLPISFAAKKQILSCLNYPHISTQLIVHVEYFLREAIAHNGFTLIEEYSISQTVKASSGWQSFSAR
jgi:hypothetical protein